MQLTDLIVLTVPIQVETITVQVTVLTNHISPIQALHTVPIQAHLIVRIRAHHTVHIPVQRTTHTPVLLLQRIQLRHIHLPEHHRLHL